MGDLSVPDRSLIPGGTHPTADNGSYLEPTFELEMEQLLQQMWSTSFDDANASQRLLNASNCHTLRASMGAEEYKRSMHNFKEQYFRSINRSGLGFDPIQVIKRHAIHSPIDFMTNRSTLVNDIHLFFAYEKFVNCSQAVYTVLLPALRLATHFLTHVVGSGYWLTLAFGKREICPVTSTMAGRPALRIRHDVPWDVHLHRTWCENILVDAGKYLEHISFDCIDPTSRIFGVAWQPYERRHHLRLDSINRASIRIGLHADLLTVASRLVHLGDNADQDMVLRFHFFFAVNLVHEVAHFIEGRFATEPYMYSNTEAEAGAAWEAKCFGGRVHPINWRMDCAYGLTTYAWPGPQRPEETVFHTISMQYIARIQQSDFWDDEWGEDEEFVGTEDGVCIIPRTGAKSLGVMAFNMAIFEDDKVAQDIDVLAEIERTFTAKHRSLKSYLLLKHRKVSKEWGGTFVGKIGSGRVVGKVTVRKTASRRAAGPTSKITKLAKKRTSRKKKKEVQDKWRRVFEMRAASFCERRRSI